MRVGPDAGTATRPPSHSRSRHSPPPAHVPRASATLDEYGVLPWLHGSPRFCTNSVERCRAKPAKPNTCFDKITAVGAGGSACRSYDRDHELLAGRRKETLH